MTITREHEGPGPTRTDAAAPPKVAVIGCGHWGKNHVRNFHQLGALAAVSDTDRAPAEGYAKEFDVSAMDPPRVLAGPGT